MNKLILLLIAMVIGISFFAVVKADVIPILTSAFTKITTPSGSVYEVNITTKDSITKSMLMFNTSSFSYITSQKDGTKRYTMGDIAKLTEEYKVITTKPNATIPK